MKIEKLEAIRGFVAVYIVFHHIVAFNHLQDRHLFVRLLFMHPQEAVLVFFLLSGFVIYLSAVKSRELSFSAYLKKRFLRIYPITITAFLISTVIYLINGHQLVIGDLKVLAGNFFMLQDDRAEPGLIVPTYLNNVPLWSLSYEWWFYVLFFPLFIFLRKRNFNARLPPVYLAASISLIGWFSFLLHPNHISLVLTYFLLWWTGVACADIYLRHLDFTLKRLMPIFISLIVVSGFISVPIIKGFLFEYRTLAKINGPYPISTYLHYYADTLLFLAIGLIWWQYRLKGFQLLFGIWKRFAPISFAIYVIHFPFIQLELPFIHNFYGLYALKLTLIIAISYLLELRMQPLINHLFHQKIAVRNRKLENQAF